MTWLRGASNHDEFIGLVGRKRGKFGGDEIQHKRSTVSKVR